MSGTSFITNSGQTPAGSVVTNQSNNTITDAAARVVLSPQPVAMQQILGMNGTSLLTPLYATNGLLFPYSPQITFNQDVEYDATNMVHTNFDFYTYRKTPSVKLQIQGKFAIQTQSDGLYALACIHFLRVVSKMYFGQNDTENGVNNGSSNAGTPPPVLLLNGYGTYMFNNLRVIVTAHSWSYDSSMDTVIIPVTYGGGNVRLPVVFDLSVSLIVQQTPTAWRTQFDLGLFRSGALMKNGGGWI